MILSSLQNTQRQAASSNNAHVAELVDAHGSGPCAFGCRGSSPFVGTTSNKLLIVVIRSKVVASSNKQHNAHVAELVDAHGSGPCAFGCRGSSPFVGTTSN